MDLPAFLIYILATWRIASLMAREPGPGDILGRMRHRLGVRYDEQSRPYGTTEASRGILCLWCNSLWVGTLLALLWPAGALWAALPFALSAGAILIDEVKP